MPEEWRKKIQTSMIANRLMDHIKGLVELTPTQVQAANILLKKTVPDLSNVVLSGDADKPVELKFRWATPAEATPDPSKKS